VGSVAHGTAPPHRRIACACLLTAANDDIGAGLPVILAPREGGSGSKRDHDHVAAIQEPFPNESGAGLR
jgi:hypothetical protein